MPCRWRRRRRACSPAKGRLDLSRSAGRMTVQSARHSTGFVYGGFGAPRCMRRIGQLAERRARTTTPKAGQALAHRRCGPNRAGPGIGLPPDELGLWPGRRAAPRSDLLPSASSARWAGRTAMCCRPALRAFAGRCPTAADGGVAILSAPLARRGWKWRGRLVSTAADYLRLAEICGPAGLSAGRGVLSPPRALMASTSASIAAGRTGWIPGLRAMASLTVAVRRNAGGRLHGAPGAFAVLVFGTIFWWTRRSACRRADGHAPGRCAALSAASETCRPIRRRRLKGRFQGFRAEELRGFASKPPHSKAKGLCKPRSGVGRRLAGPRQTRPRAGRTPGGRGMTPPSGLISAAAFFRPP